MTKPDTNCPKCGGTGTDLDHWLEFCHLTPWSPPCDCTAGSLGDTSRTAPAGALGWRR